MFFRLAYRMSIIALILVVILAGVTVQLAQAASIVVTTDVDNLSNDGFCSLREAITNSNEKGRTHNDCVGGSGSDEISFASGITNITLGSTLPPIKENLTINGGNTVTISGGGSVRLFQVNNKSTLALNEITITGGDVAGNGGGVLNQGTLVVTNSRFTNNTATNGGSIYSNGGTTTINNTAFVANRGYDSGGALVFSTSGVQTITNSLFEGNIAYNPSLLTGSGGGVDVEAGTTVEIINSTFSNNQANGAADDGGGGLMVYGGTVTVTNSTFSGNVSANTATSQGAGIRRSGGTVTLRNTILSDNTGGGNCSGTLTDGGGNLVWGDATCPGTQANPQLQALANNGGLTQTMALGSGSAAVNRASANCPASDQRGYNRRNGFCDSGAFEAQPASVTATSGTPQYAVRNFEFAQPLMASVLDSYNNLLAGVTITFTAPASGASAGLSSSTATTNASGNASVTATANNISGAYSVSAASDAVTQVSFLLTNTDVEVLSITRAAVTPTNAASVSFTVTFNVAVNGVDANDFTLSTSGVVASAAISGVSGSGYVYTVTVDTGSGDGSLRLDVTDDDSISDVLYGQLLGGSGAGNGNFTTGEAYTIDKTAPDTTITDGPASLTPISSASFEFESNESSSIFECSLDGSSFGACPANYTSLIDGAHTFQVRATDTAGNTDPTPAQYIWTVDATAPSLTMPADITMEATGPSGVVVTFSVTATDAIDSSPVVVCFPASGVTFPLGVTQVNCTATDTAGNSTSGSINVTVQDTTPPDTYITNPPSNPTNSTMANFTITSSEPGSSFECSLDGAGYTTCTNPVSYTGLVDGEHTFSVQATDVSGNTDLTPADYAWTVNTIRPALTIDIYPANPTNNTNTSFSFTVTPGGVGIAAVACWIDSDPPTDCASGTFSAVVAQGSHTFQVASLDLSGNTASVDYTWTVDTTPPAAQVSSLPTFETSSPFNVSWNGSDALSGIASYDVQVQEAGAGWTDWLTASALTSSLYTSEEGKSYSFRVRAVDQAGNTGEWSSPIATTVDTIAPTVLMSSPQLVSGNTYLVSWSGSDATAGVAYYLVEIQEESGAWTTWQNNTTVTSAQFTATPGVHYHFRVRAVDQAGNVGEWSQTVDVMAWFKLFIPQLRRAP